MNCRFFFFLNTPHVVIIEPFTLTAYTKREGEFNTMPTEVRIRLFSVMLARIRNVC